MIEDYENKMRVFLIRQNYKCSGCGEYIGNYCRSIDEHGNIIFYVIKNGVYEKLDFAHNLPRTKKNIKNLPLFIDSIENGSIQHNHCNVERKPPYWKTGEYKKEKPINYYQAEQIEKRMQKE